MKHYKMLLVILCSGFMGKTIGLGVFMLAIIALGSLNAGCTATTPGKQSAGTGAALGAINDKIQDGTIKIEGDTDSAPLP